jgi:hypothetical protein
VPRGLGRLGHLRIDAVDDLGHRTDEVTFVVDIADELLGQRRFAGREIEQRDLVEQVVAQVARRGGDRLVVLLLLVLLPPAAGIESFEQDLFPVDFVLVFLFLGLLRRGLGFGGALVLFILLGLDQLQKRVRLELLFQVLLQVEQRHVQEVHRLIQARIDLQLLSQLRTLMQSCLHQASGGTGRYPGRGPTRPRSALAGAR